MIVLVVFFTLLYFLHDQNNGVVQIFEHSVQITPIETNVCTSFWKFMINHWLSHWYDCVYLQNIVQLPNGQVLPPVNIEPDAKNNNLYLDKSSDIVHRDEIGGQHNKQYTKENYLLSSRTTSHSVSFAGIYLHLSLICQWYLADLFQLCILNL